MKTLNIAKICGIAGTILALLFILVLIASCNSELPNSVPEPRYDPRRTLPKYLGITASFNGLKDETVLVKTHIYDMGTGKENAVWRHTGNGRGGISIREPEEGNVYTIIAEAEGHTVQPESYKVRIMADDTAVITNNETGEEVSQLDFQFIPLGGDSDDNGTSQNVTISQIISQADRYDGKVVTLDAFYFYAVLEINALADSVRLDSSDDGKVVPVGAQIRVKGDISQELLNQLYTQESPSPTNTEYFGKLKITGRFEIDDQDGQYHIDITSAEVLEWTPPQIGTITPNGNLRIKVSDFGDRALQGTKIVSGTQPDGQPELSGMTDADGTITFENIKQGRYEFTASLADYIQMNIKLTVTGGRMADVAFHIARVGEAPDDLLPAPGMGPQYRANITAVRRDGTHVVNPWPTIESTMVTKGISSEAVQITYRDYIETAAGQTRNNMFYLRRPGSSPNDNSLAVVLEAIDPPSGITVTQDGGWSGPATQTKAFLKIEISPQVEPGEHTLNINVEINGKDYGSVPCTIKVLE